MSAFNTDRVLHPCNPLNIHNPNHLDSLKLKCGLVVYIHKVNNSISFPLFHSISIWSIWPWPNPGVSKPTGQSRKVNIPTTRHKCIGINVKSKYICPIAKNVSNHLWNHLQQKCTGWPYIGDMYSEFSFWQHSVSCMSSFKLGISTSSVDLKYCCFVKKGSKQHPEYHCYDNLLMTETEIYLDISSP